MPYATDYSFSGIYDELNLISNTLQTQNKIQKKQICSTYIDEFVNCKKEDEKCKKNALYRFNQCLNVVDY